MVFKLIGGFSTHRYAQASFLLSSSDAQLFDSLSEKKQSASQCFFLHFRYAPAQGLEEAALIQVISCGVGYRSFNPSSSDNHPE